MKTKSKLMYGLGGCLFLLLSAVVACSKDDSVEKNDAGLSKRSPGFESLITVTRSTDLTTDTFFNMGVRSINVSQNSDAITYTFDAYRDFELNGTTYSYGPKRFILKDEALFEAGDPSTAIVYRNRDFYVRTGGSETPLRQMTNFGENNNIAALVILTHQLTADPLTTTSYSNHVAAFSSGGGCSFWDTYYVFGIGMTDAAASADLEYSMAHSSYAHNSHCTKLNTRPQASHLSVGIFEVSTLTNTYCCHF